MKTRLIFVTLALMSLVGCGLPSQGDIQTSLTQTQTQLHDLQTQLHEQQAASTQPNATQPAPPASAVKAVDDLAKKVDQLQVTLNALPPNANPGQWIQAVAPATGPAAPWVGLAGLLISIGWALFQTKKASTATAALTTTTDGLHAAISTGAITVTPNAPAIVNAAVIDHPETSKVVDMLSDAAKSPRIV